MTEPFILDPDYVDYTPEKLKYESVITKELKSFIEESSLLGLFFLSQLPMLPIICIFLIYGFAHLSFDLQGLICAISPVLILFIIMDTLPWKKTLFGIALLLISLRICLFFNINGLLVIYAIYTTVVSIGMIVFYLINLNTYLRRRHRCVRMANYGVVIDGELIEATSKYKRANAGREDCYVTARYKYMTLSGYDREGTQRWKRNDLKQKTLPSKGTPVKVLYADEKAVIML